MSRHVLRFTAVLVLAVAVPAVPAARLSVLSEEPRLELRRNFATEAELAAVSRLAEEEMFKDLSDPESGSTSSPDVAGGQELSTLNISDPDVDTEDALEWEVVKDLVERSKAWAAGPLDAMGVFVVRWEPWRYDSQLNRSGPLHLDARLRPRRRHSVLLQLTGRGRVEDGATVFPCLETDDMDARELKRRQKLCSRAMRHLELAHEKLMRLRDQGLELPPHKQYDFLEEHPELSSLPPESADGTRPVNYLWLPSHDAVAGNETMGALRADSLHGLVEAMCQGQAKGVKVNSRRGDALLMEVMNPESRQVKADWRLWHAGCSPLEPHQRLTAQIFLEEKVQSNSEQCGGSETATCTGSGASRA